MPYIPQRHKEYNLLPYCNKNGGEVFEYPSELLQQIDDIIPDGETLIPYGYKSYDEYFAYLDQWIEHYDSDEKTKELLLRFRRKMIALNQKETWAVLKYVGETTDDLFGLTYNKYYYCPRPQAVYDTFGVIDDEEFTSYMYSCNPTDWELYEDPTGEASKVLSQVPKTNMICPCCGKHYFLYASDNICPVCGWKHDTSLKEKLAEDRDNYNSLNEIKKRFNPTKIDITLLFTSAFKNLSKTQTAFICYEFDIDKDELFSFSERQLDCLYSTLKMFEWKEEQSNNRTADRYENIHRILERIEEYFRFTLGNSLFDNDYSINDVVNAHQYCNNHRAELEVKQKCGCFYCLSIFNSSEITEWLQDSNPCDYKGTAICPKCGIDSVIGESSGHPITLEFLKSMHNKWFE